MDDLVSHVVREIQRAPGMYLGQKSAIRLRAFLDGVVYAQYLQNIQPYGSDVLQSFRDWIYLRYPELSSLSWELVLVQTGGGDQEAFDLFGKLWDQFQHERGNAANKTFNPSGGS